MLLIFQTPESDARNCLRLDWRLDYDLRYRSSVCSVSPTRLIQGRLRQRRCPENAALRDFLPFVRCPLLQSRVPNSFDLFRIPGDLRRSI